MVRKILGLFLMLPFLLAWSPYDEKNYLAISKSSVQLQTDNGATFCSGSVFSVKEGLISTAAHCIRSFIGAGVKTVEYPDGHFEKKTFRIFYPIRIRQDVVDVYGNPIMALLGSADIQVYNETLDVAILQGKKDYFLGEMKWSKDPVKVGDRIYALSAPAGEELILVEGRVTKAKVSNFPAAKQIPNGAIVIAITGGPGISGGPLFNDKGEYVGMTNWGIPGYVQLAAPVRFLEMVYAEMLKGKLGPVLNE